MDYFESFELEMPDGKPSIKFDGEMLASASSLSERKGFTGVQERWMVLELYKTKGGKYIARSIGKSSLPGETDLIKTLICESLDEVKKFFGYQWLAKILYQRANIDYSISID